MAAACTSTSVVEAEPTQAPSASASPAVETLEQQYERIARIVAEQRGLEFTAPPEATYLSPDELAARAAEFTQDYSDADADLDARVLIAFGVLSDETDLKGLLTDALAEQVGGFYDPDTGEMVVGRTGDGGRLGPLGEAILAHELDHALVDQAIGLPDLGDDDGRADQAYARLSLVEGDASVIMDRYMAVGFSIIDQVRLQGEGLELGARLAEGTPIPPYIQRSLTFPYTEGAGFVEALIAEGGWERVDAAYDAPPSTSYEILFPQAYLAGFATTDVDASGSPGDGWRRRRVDTFGAADWLFLFEAPQGDPFLGLADARGALAGWRGGEIAVWTREGQTGVAVVTAVSRDDGGALCAAVLEWYARTDQQAEQVVDADGGHVFLGSERAARVRCSDTSVRLGIGPTDAEAAGLTGEPS